MKLFDLSPGEKQDLTKFLAWHFGYIVYVALFAFLIYHYHLFKTHWLLKEFWILNLLAPVHTVIFIVIGPYRKDWAAAIRNMYRALDGDPVFCLMALLVFVLGFYLYNGLIWALGGFLPSLFFT